MAKLRRVSFQENERKLGRGNAQQIHDGSPEVSARKSESQLLNELTIDTVCCHEEISKRLYSLQNTSIHHPNPHDYHTKINTNSYDLELDNEKSR
jgi:hypothetical protein